MIALPSMMHPDPITIGPAMAKMVALGWTMVPGCTVCSLRVFLGWGSVVRTSTYGDIALELDILADDSL